MSRSQWTKQLVDNHVTNTLKQVKDEKERKLRSFQFAKMYFDVKEYEHARRYLLAFMSVKDNMPAAYKLLGNILEMQNQPAIDAYRRSLDLDPQQNDVLLKVCDLYSRSSAVTPDVAKFWAEKAEKVFPGHDIVFKLKMKASEGSGNGDTQQDLLDLLISEVEKYPWDVSRHVRLFRQYIVMGRVDEAYTRAVQIDVGSQANFMSSLDFHRCLCEIFKIYKDEMGSKVNGFFHQHYLSALNNLTALCLEKAAITESVDALWSFDQVLALVSAVSSQRDDWKIFCREMEAQYFFHCGTLILNKALKERLSWHEASELATACFAASYSVPQPSSKSAWFAKAKDDERKVYNEWLKSACYRCSQTGHMLSNLAPNRAARNWIEKVHQDYCQQQGKERLFQLLYTQQHQKEKSDTSFLLKNTLFTTFIPRFPDAIELRESDQEAQQLRPNSLHHTVWVCLQAYTVRSNSQPDYSLKLFEGLSYETSNLKVAGPESLRQLDVEAFLYAVVRSEALKQAERRKLLDDSRPSMLPAAINELLCSPEQQEWWNSVYRLVTNTARDSLGQSRAILQRGLETIRLVANGGLDVDLTVHLARTFAERAEEKQSNAQSSQDFQSEISFLTVRAVHYWKGAIEKLEKIEKKHTMRAPKYCLFENRDDQLTETEIKLYLTEGRLFLAKQLAANGNYSDALELLNQIQTAEASFETALVYKACALNETRQIASSVDSSASERRAVMLSRAKDALYLTLDRIRGDRLHVLNAGVAEEMELIDTYMLQTTVVNGDGFDSNDLALPLSNSQMMTPNRGFGRPTSGMDGCMAQSTPRVGKQQSASNIIACTSPPPPPSSSGRFRPSPDRLDAEIRSLRFMQDNVMKTLTDDMRGLRNTVEHVQCSVQQSAERLTGMEAKLAMILEFQRQQMHQMLLLSRPMIPTAAAPLPARPGAPLPNDNLAYEYSTLPGYDPTIYIAPQIPRPGPPAPQQNYPPFQPVAIQPGYMLPAVGHVQHQNQTDEYDYGNDRYDYNDDDYGENALGYEIQDPLIPLVTREIFLSGGDSSRATTVAPILPGFFTSSVKQSIAEASNNNLASNVTPTTKPSSKDARPATSAAAGFQATDLRVNKPSAMEPRLTLKDSATSSAVTTDDETSVASSSVPVSVPTTSQPKPILVAPKFVASPSAISPAVLPASTVKSDTKATSSAPVNSNKPKTMFGGITFSSTPVVASTKDAGKDSRKDEAAKDTKPPNPFANFSFNLQQPATPDQKKEADKGTGSSTSVFAGFGGFSPSSASSTSVASQPKTTVAALDTKVTTTSALSAPIFGNSNSATSPSFASVAAQKSPQAFVKKSDNAGTFQGAGQPVFKSTSVKSPGGPSTGKSSDPSRSKTNPEDEECTGEEYVPDAEFKPLVSLPEVEVKTGEEGEEKLFGERAKLYRMDNDSKQWKERGIGEVKILCNRETGRYRIVMRREQVLKLCANHYITASIVLVPLTSSETSLCWFANDYSEGEMQKEQLCIKFKTIEQQKKFKVCFEECQAKIGQAKVAVAKESTPAASASGTKTSTTTSGDATKPLSALFQSKPGQWQCSECYLTNLADKSECAACTAPKPGTSKPTPSVPVVPAPAAATTVETKSDKPSLSSQFQAKPGEWECSTCYVRNPADKTSCLSCETLKPGATPSTQSAASQPTSTDSAFKISATGGFSFGSVGAKPFSFGGISFSSTPTTAAATTASTESATTSTSSTAQGTPSGPTGGFVMPKTVNFGSFKVTQTTASASTPATTAAPVFAFGSAPKSTTSSSATGGLFPSLNQAPTTTSTPARPAAPFHLSSSTPTLAGSENKSSFGSSSFNFQGVKPALSQTNLPSGLTPFKFSGFGETASPVQPPRPESPSSPKSPENEHGDNSVEFEPNVTFEPIVQLPDDVEVKTGEEDEDVLYCHRAKLFRFADSEWKERGVGDVKILRHRATGIVRIIMRRERVHKICMNHRITLGLTLQPMANSQGKAWMWHTNDFADNESKHEQFSIRFKTEEIATDFKIAFDGAKTGAPVLSIKDDSVRSEQKPQPEDGKVELEEKPGSSGSQRSLLMDLLTAAPPSSTQVELSSDDCILVEAEVKMPPDHLVKKATELQLPPTFYNYLDLPACPGCIGCKSAVDADQSTTTGSAESKPIFGSSSFVPKTTPQLTAIFGGGSKTSAQSAVFGSSATFSFSVAQKATAQPTAIFGTPSSIAPTAVFGTPSSIASESGVTKPMTIFGPKAGTTPSPAVFGGGSSGSVFGNSAKIVGFAELSQSSSSATGFGQKSGDKSFTWAGSGAQLFTKSPKPADRKSANDTEADGNDSAGEDEGGNDDDNAADNIHFEPIVQLPECVDLKTGEEDEVELYKQRAKLYRYDKAAAQWKERAVGDMKILKNKLTGNFRLLMRREQVHKVACNQLLTTDMNLQQMQTSETAWCWFGYDYADTEPDDEPKIEQFAIRFKSVELTAAFREKFEACQSELRNAGKGSRTGDATQLVEDNVNNNDGSQSTTKETASVAATGVTGGETASVAATGVTAGETTSAVQEAEAALFEKRATVVFKDTEEKLLGELKVFADDSSGNGARLVMQLDSGHEQFSHFIRPEDTLERTPRKPAFDLSFVAKTDSGEQTRTLSIQFSSSGSADEFEKLFKQLTQSCSEAQQSES